MLLAVVCIPILVGAALGFSGHVSSRLPPPARRMLSGATAALTLLVLVSLLAATGASATPAVLDWGPGLAPGLELTPTSIIPAFVVVLVALPVVVWAAAHEELAGIERLVGGLLAFVGAMELLVLASDLLALTIGWELVGVISWLLIAHQWPEKDRASAAAYAFNATRVGGMGLFLAAGAAWASTGSFAFSELPRVASGPWGDLLAAGIVLAAVAKSAQLPFSPWLFRAMQGPSSVSALLHSSTMVAAGAWLLIRLHAPLESVPWFRPVVLGIGLATACVAGVVACVQTDAKRLLAASTSAHYGLMFTAVGAGAAGPALAHLVMHAAFKALLFIAAGIAVTAAGTHDLKRMHLGRALPWTAAVSLVGALALAGVPPLGGAWSKEHIITAIGEHRPVLMALTIGAGGLAAWYGARFQRLAFGRDAPARASVATPPRVASVALAVLGAYTIALSASWLPSVGVAAQQLTGLSLPPLRAGEMLISLAVVASAGVAGWMQARPEIIGAAPSSPLFSATARTWFGLPTAIDHFITAPTVGAANTCVRLELRLTRATSRVAVSVGDRFAAWLALGAARGRTTALATTAALRSAELSTDVLERAVDGTAHRFARALDTAGDRLRRVHTGAVPLHYALVIGGLAAFVALLAIGR